MKNSEICMAMHKDFHIGDKVSFLNEDGNGEIISFPTKGKALVLTEVGLEIEYPVKYLVHLSDFEEYDLSHTEENRFIKAKLQDAKPKKSKKTAPKLRVMETDLHIYNLVDDHRHLSNGDMLRIQLNHFKNKMNEARKKGMDKLIIIHGVGEGVLRSEIRHALRNYEFIEFLDADYSKYGSGATEVRFFREK